MFVHSVIHFGVGKQNVMNSLNEMVKTMEVVNLIILIENTNYIGWYTPTREFN
jgi:hypothetical protein